MSVYVTHPDPFPADGGGFFPAELNMVTQVRAFDRGDPQNPFRDATFVFVPYCTGDLHTGDAVHTYPYQHDAFGQPQQYTFHFAGAPNMEAYLSRLKATRPGAQRIWLTGSSAGGYGATFHFERVQQKFPGSEVALLADSAPLVHTPLHWEEWRETWQMQFPQGCASCDAGFPEVIDHLITSYPDRRIGLLAFDRDAVLSYFFYGGVGPNAALDPPTGTYLSFLDQMLPSYDGQANAAYFVLPGTDHVMWGGYGTRLADGGYTAPRKSADGGTDLKTWIDAWATGDGGFVSVR